MTNFEDSLTVQPLEAGHAGETLEYLEARPVETAYLCGLIRDNGVESAQNRGVFYACRDRAGRLRGVQMIGDALLFASDDASATKALARFARRRRAPRIIRGESGAVEHFWQAYADGQNLPHASSAEQLLVLRETVESHEPADGLRPATLEDLTLLVEINAAMLSADGGRNPLESDPEGFRRRLAQRIERGRVWVWREGALLVFKSDVLAETPRAAYIEGVYVAPERRGRGVGLRCVAQMGSALLERAAAVCLTVRRDNDAAQALYRRAGFRLHCEHTTIYLQPARQCASA